jgi:hypothetical protein
VTKLPIPVSQAVDGDARRLPVFAFGAFLEHALVENLLEHSVPMEPARLLGHAVQDIEGIGAPVLVQKDDEQVEGRIYRGLAAPDFYRLDSYCGVGEGLYLRRAATALTARSDETGSSEEVFVYLPTTRTLQRGLAARREPH